MEAFELQKQNPKKIFVDVYTDWCGWCKKMDRETFSKENVAKYMNGNFYCVKFNAEGNDTIVFQGQKFINSNYGKRRATHPFARILLNSSMSYPSFVFLDEKSKGIMVVKGYREAPAWMPYLRYVVKNKYKNMNFKTYFQKEEAE